MKYLKEVATIELNRERCNGCHLCTEVCPRGVFIIEEKKARIVDRDKCIECGACALNCETKAISVDAGVGCAEAVLNSMLYGGEPSCDCSGGGNSCC